MDASIGESRRFRQAISVEIGASETSKEAFLGTTCGLITLTGELDRLGGFLGGRRRLSPPRLQSFKESVVRFTLVKLSFE